MNDSIGAKLKTLRKGRKLTQFQLAEQLSVNRATISNYEIGRMTPNLNDLKRFAKFYGVGLDYFGVAATDEVFDLISRAKDIFQSDDVPANIKQEIFEEIMRLHLKLKSRQ